MGARIELLWSAGLARAQYLSCACCIVNQKAAPAVLRVAVKAPDRSTYWQLLYSEVDVSCPFFIESGSGQRAPSWSQNSSLNF